MGISRINTEAAYNFAIYDNQGAAIKVQPIRIATLLIGIQINPTVLSSGLLDQLKPPFELQQFPSDKS